MAISNTNKNDLYRIVPYKALPCELSLFTIRGRKADKSDFGAGKNVGGPSGYEDIDRWGCSDYRWRRDETKRQKAMHKYGITSDEFDIICDALESALTVGMCGECI